MNFTVNPLRPSLSFADVESSSATTNHSAKACVSWGQLWIACVALGILNMGVMVLAMRRAFSDSSAWFALGNVLSALPFSFMCYYPWCLAFPGATLDRRCWVSVAIGYAIFFSVETLNDPPHPVRQSGTALVQVLGCVSRALVWVGLLVLPAWLTRNYWWDRRSRGMFRIVAAYVVCCIVSNVVVNRAVISALGPVMTMFMLCGIGFCCCDRRQHTMPDGGYLMFLVVMTSGWPIIFYMMLKLIDGMTSTGGSIFVLGGWIGVNCLLFIWIVRCTEIAIGPSAVALMLFPFLVATDTMLALIFLDTELTDVLFWLVLVVETLWKVARDAGFMNALSDWLGYRGCQLSRSAVQLANEGVQLRGQSVKNVTKGFQANSTQSFKMPSADARSSVRTSARASTARARIAVESDVRATIHILSCTSEMMASLGLFIMLLFDSALGHHFGDPVLLVEGDRRGAIHCFAVLVLTDLATILVVRWVRRSRLRLTDDDVLVEKAQVSRFFETHHAFLLCSTVLITGQCIYRVSRLNSCKQNTELC